MAWNVAGLKKHSQEMETRGLGRAVVDDRHGMTGRGIGAAMSEIWAMEEAFE